MSDPKSPAGGRLSEAALAEFICPYDVDMGLRFLATVTPERRAVYERMAQVCDEIDLWQAGVGPKPAGVIICGPKQVKAALLATHNTETDHGE